MKSNACATTDFLDINVTDLAEKPQDSSEIGQKS